MSVKIKISVLLFVLIGLNFSLKAQQDPMYSQYLHVPLAINPAYTGSSGMLSAQFLGREQWVGMSGAPKTRLVTLHSPLKSYNVGFGGFFLNDEYGPVRSNSYYATMSYKLNLGHGKLAFGLSAGIDRLDILLRDLDTHDSNDDFFRNNYSEHSKWNFGLGFYYYTKTFFAGLAVPRLVENKKNMSYVKRHLFFASGILIPLTVDFQLQPTVSVGVVENAPLLLTASANIIYQDKLWFGLNFRYPDAVGLSLAYQINQQIRIGYAYDFNFWQAKYNIGGSHEIFLSFDMRFNKSKVMTPRYF